MKRSLRNLAVSAALMAGLIPLSVGADQLFIRNRAFKGATSTLDGALWVELKPLAEALGANLIDNGKGGYAMSLDPIPKIAAQEVASDKLIIGAETIDVQQKNGVALVPLEATAKLVKARISANKQLHTIDVNFVTAPQVAAPEPVTQAPPPSQSTTSSKTKKPLKSSRYSKPSPRTPSTGNQMKDTELAMDQRKKELDAFKGKTLHIHGKIGVEGADKVGLFEGGSASVPYKVGTTDANGNYKMDIDLDKDLHNGMTDMRFYSSRGFDQCHGK